MLRKQFGKATEWYNPSACIDRPQFPKSFFRINLLGYSSGMVVVDHSHLKEFLEAPEDHVSFSIAFNDGFNLPYLFHGDPRDDYHTRVIRGKMTKNISSSIPALVDELNAIFAEDSDFQSILSTGIIFPL